MRAFGKQIKVIKWRKVSRDYRWTKIWFNECSNNFYKVSYCTKLSIPDSNNVLYFQQDNTLDTYLESIWPWTALTEDELTLCLRGRLQTTWIEFWAILNPSPHVDTFNKNSFWPIPSLPICTPGLYMSPKILLNKTE